MQEKSCVFMGAIPTGALFFMRLENAFLLSNKGDIIEMTAANINNADTMDYLVPDTADFKLTGANAAGDGLCLHKIGTSMLHIGSSMMQNSHPVTYKYEVVNN